MSIRVVKRAYKYRFYPSEQQAELLSRTFGSVRYVRRSASGNRSTDRIARTRGEHHGASLALVAHGLSNDEIGDALVLSPATAKTHVSRAMIKLGARGRAQLAVFAYQTGLVTPRTAGQAPGH